MKTQISQFPPILHRPYSGVYQQQGRMITDADWNAATQVGKDRLDLALADVIGKGTPETGGIVAGDADAGFELVWGDLYVDGIRGELISRSGAPAFDLTDQADFPGAIAAPEGAHRLYVDVWERSLTALEEATLLDAALHGADTTTRTRTMAQVKVCPQDFDPEDPDQNPPIGEGRLTLTLRAGTASPDACEPCLDELDLGGDVGNYAFRIEIHHVERDNSGAPTRLTLKWSRENGAEAALIDREPPGFISQDWIYEFYNNAAEESATESHAGFHHPDVLSNGFTEARGELTEGFPDAAPGGFALVRRWDGYAVFERNGATWELATQVVDAENVPHGRDMGQRLSTELGEAQHGHVNEGATILMSLDTMTLSLELADHQHLAGDYWIGVVRQAIHSAGDVLRDDALPDGIQHHYMSLADVDTDGVLTLLNGDVCKRFQFPPLTNIHADDVCYDNSACDMPGVGNVQEALDHLCQQKDLKWHNKHLHGWGIVCGLIVECCDPDAEEDNDDRDEDPTQCVTLSKGYAIDCEGCDIVVDGPLHVDLMDDVRAWDEENPDNPILTNGSGTACLHIVQEGGEPVVKVEPHEGSDNDFLQQLLDGTLLGDFVQHCILDLISALTEELAFLEDGQLPSEDGKELVSQERRKLISFANLVQQIFFKANGPYVWMSRREYDILRALYNRLRELLGSKTFCGMFNADSFPPYAFDDTRIDTWFGAEVHTRVLADPTGQRVYTYGGADEVIQVFDVSSGELVEIIRMPVPEGGEVTAIACSPDGRLLYAAATVNGADTVLGIAQVGDTHRFERPMQIICDITIAEMWLDPRDEGLIHALGLGRGLFALRPSVLAEEEKPVPDAVYPFNASGHMAVDPVSRRIFCTALASSDDVGAASNPDGLYDRVVICPMDTEEGGGAPDEVLLRRLDDRFNVGRDDIAVRAGESSTVYLVLDPIDGGADDKSIITFDVPRSGSEGAQLRARLVVQDTDIALAFDQKFSTLYASFSDSFRVQAIAEDGVEVLQARVPVQLGPTDLVTNGNGDIYVVNAMSNTITAIPPEEVALSEARLSPLAQMRWRMLLAFYALVGNLFQYLKDCFCHHLLIKCPECDGDEKIYLACVEIRAEEERGSQVYNICNFGKRKYVQTFMAWNYWLSIVPVIPLMKQAIAKACCAVLPNFLDNFTENIAPPPPPPEFGAATGVAVPVKSATAMTAVATYKRTDIRALQRQQFGNAGLLGNFASDAVFSAGKTGFRGGAGLRKETLRNARTEEAVRELQSAGISEVAVRPYDPQRAGDHALDYVRTPARLDKSARVIVYEKDGKAVFIAEDRTRMSPIEVSAADKAEVEAMERKVRDLEAQRKALQDDLVVLNQGLESAAELRRTLRVEVESVRPLKELEAVDARTAAKLESAGIRTIGDLAEANSRKLSSAKVGSNTAARNALITKAKERLQ